MNRPVLEESIRAEVLSRLEMKQQAEPTLEGLKALYRAWGEHVPFDNSAKLIALHTGSDGRLPGIESNEFFSNYLEHGFGGTCWPSSNALYSLLIELGFDARRLAGSMRDTGIISHGSTKVVIDGADWLVDSSMLTCNPLPLTSGLFVASDPVFSAEVEYVDGRHLIWWDSVPAPEYIPCRMLADEVTYDFYLERYEASRERSPFNERIYVRRNYPDSMLVITGNRRYVKTARGVEFLQLSAPELEDALIREARFSRHTVDALRECGAIEASMAPPQGPPPPVGGVRPSKRSSPVAS